MLTFVHQYSYGSYLLKHNYNTGRISSSQIRMIVKDINIMDNNTNNNVVNRLWVFNSYGYIYRDVNWSTVEIVYQMISQFLIQLIFIRIIQLFTKI